MQAKAVEADFPGDTEAHGKPQNLAPHATARSKVRQEAHPLLVGYW